MRYCQYLYGCVCVWCGQTIAGAGYIDHGWSDGVICEKCYLEISQERKEAQKQACLSFYNDPDAKQMLIEKLQDKTESPSLLAKIKQALYSLSPTLSNWQAKQPKVDLEQIKAIPIGDLMPYPAKRRYGQKELYICPLHNDHQPSFQWDKTKNRFKCWSCGEYGSPIDLYMKLNNCDFKTAIKVMHSTY